MCRVEQCAVCIQFDALHKQTNCREGKEERVERASRYSRQARDGFKSKLGAQEPRNRGTGEMKLKVCKVQAETSTAIGSVCG